MAKAKSVNLVNQEMSEEKITQILANFQPTPSPLFYTRMQKAPWTKRYRITRYALQIAILVAAICAVILINPSTIQPLSSTHTPTSTPTMGSTNPSIETHFSTDIPLVEDTPVNFPSETPSNLP